MYRTLTVILLVAVLSVNAAARRPVTGSKDWTPGPKSPATATMLSLLGTVAPIGASVAFAARADGYSTGASLLLLGGWVVGPGLGHAYSDNGNRLATGMIIRGSVIVAAVAVAAGAQGEGHFGPSEEAGAILLVGLGLTSASAVYDIVTADNSAKKYNQKHGFTNVSVTPTCGLADNTAGLRLALNF